MAGGQATRKLLGPRFFIVERVPFLMQRKNSKKVIFVLLLKGAGVQTHKIPPVASGLSSKAEANMM